MTTTRSGIALLATVSLLAAAMGGFSLSRLEVGRLEREVARLERSNQQLRANADVLAEGLRGVRAPLEGRIAALEARLGGSPDSAAPEPSAPVEAGSRVAVRPVGEPGLPSPAEAPAREREPAEISAPEPRAGEWAGRSPPERREQDGTRPPGSGPGAEPRSPDPTARPQAPAVAAGAARADESAIAAAPRRQAAPSDGAGLPAVSAPPRVETEPRVAARSARGSTRGLPDPACRALAESHFAFSAVGDEEQRLGGRLSLALTVEGEDLALLVAGDPDSPYALSDLPLYLSFPCDGVPYMVSVCEVTTDPVDVRGVVSHAEAWSPPCQDGPTGPW